MKAAEVQKLKAAQLLHICPELEALSEPKDWS